MNNIITIHYQQMALLPNAPHESWHSPAFSNDRTVVESMIETLREMHGGEIIIHSIKKAVTIETDISHLLR